MNNMAPDLSGLVPYMLAFIAVAVVGAVVSLAIIAQAAATFVLAKRHSRAARPDSVLRATRSVGPNPARPSRSA